MKPIPMNISTYIDHTLLKPTLNSGEINQLCNEARQYQFAAVCIPPAMVTLTKELISGSKIILATVIGFPFGYSCTNAKFEEIKDAIDGGADELDVVINLIQLKARNYTAMEREMQLLTELVHDRRKIIKVIIETGVLSDEEIISCCRIYGQMGVDFLKTSTGYAEKGATVEAVQLIKKQLPATVRIKASGGIRTYEFARQLIDAGASRLGCSASVAIMSGVPSAKAPGY